MYKLYIYFLLFAFAGKSYAQKAYEYPLTLKDSAVDVYFETMVKDPYQWMEDTSHPKLLEWLESQEKLKKKIKRKHLKTLELKPQIASMYHGVREKQIDGYVKKDKKLKSKYEISYKAQRLNRYPNLLYRLRGKSNYKMLLDVKKYRKNKTDNIEITDTYINEDEDLIAVKVSHNGSDWVELFFFDLKTGEPLGDSLKFLRRSSRVIWDGSNVYYDGFDRPIEGSEFLDKVKGQKLYYHKLEDHKSKDQVLYENPDSTGVNRFYFSKIKDKIYFYNSFKYKGKLYRALSLGEKLLDSFNLKKFLVYPNDNKINIKIEEVFGDKVFLKTNWNAPNGRLLVVDLKKPNKPVELIPEYDVILKRVNRLGKNKIACIYRNENKYLALIFDLEGNLLKRIDFPEGKKVNNFYEKNEKAEYTDFCVSSFYHPDLWYQLNLEDLTFKPSISISVPYDPESLETRYVKYTSKDGTQIPMYITCLKKTKLNGKNPTLLYGYGGYGVTVEPSFDESRALWLLHGGILAIPNVRGGGAEGAEWAINGRRLKKQNAIDDFIAAAEYLVKEKYTNSNNLGANGGSHGGLLVGAAAMQRPKLFKAVVAEAGVFDMLRFGRFTVGSVNTNINEFGVVTDSLDFKNLKSYSPLHNIKEGLKYPNMLLITGDLDDRVPPFHSYKFLATLQEKSNPESLFLLYLINGAGHGGALTFEDWVSKMLYKYAFLYEQLF